MKATFGAGCFWGVEEAFRKLGDTEVGYSGGDTKHPSYWDVATRLTGHAEVVQITFDEKKISYKEVLKLFWKVHDPTQKNRQGPDVGSEYRSIIFYRNAKQKKEAEESLQEEQKKYDKPIVTEIVPFEEFYHAEEYHQKYLMKRNLKTC